MTVVEFDPTLSRKALARHESNERYFSNVFFVLSKILWPLLCPASLAFLSLAAGLLVVRRWRGFGMALIAFAGLVLFVFGVSPVGHNLMHHLEQSSARPGPMPEKISGILVLGGAVETKASQKSGQPEVNDGADRILAGLTLAQRYPEARLVFSGGSGLLRDQELQESGVIRQLLENIGFPAERVVYEDKSRNTFENLRNTKDMFSPGPEERWILVTSAYHMKRAMAISRYLGWDLLPYPVDYQTSGDYVLWPESYDVLRSLYLSEFALREWAGFFAYRMTGKL